MGCMESLFMIVTSFDEDMFAEDMSSWTEEEVLDNAFYNGWITAAGMALGNAAGLFSSPREAVEVLFEELASDELEGDAFVEAMGSLLSAPPDESNPQVQPQSESEPCPGQRCSAWDCDNRSLGERGEEAAARCLERKGYEILERNWRCRFGEADIIARDPSGTIVFVEVKTRRTVKAGLPEEAVSRSKRRRYENIALEYMAKNQWEDGTPLRFDAIAICVNGPNKAILRHHVGFFNGCH